MTTDYRSNAYNYVFNAYSDGYSDGLNNRAYDDGLCSDDLERSQYDDGYTCGRYDYINEKELNK